MEPAFLINYFGCELRRLVISHHHINAFAEYLSVAGYLYFNALDYRTYSSEAQFINTKGIHSYHRRGLCKSVTLNDRQTSSPEDLFEPRLKSCTSGDHNLNLPAESFLPFAENKFAGYSKPEFVER